MSLKKTSNEVNDFLKSSNNNIIFFFDEGRFGLQATLTRIWAEKGRPVEIKVKQGYDNFYIFSSVSPKTGDLFSLFLPEVNTVTMNIYLTKMEQEFAGKKIMLIMDQAAWHKSDDLIVSSNIQIKFLPPYSPELNPVEKLWWWLKKEVTHNRVFKNLDEMADELEKEFVKLTPNFLLTLCGCGYL